MSVASASQQKGQAGTDARKEMRIVGFLCNWCSYGGADTAGVGRFSQPTDLRIIRLPCSGRINPLFILKALIQGADGVLVSGCHPNDCHYSEGNFYARRRLEVLKRFLPMLGMDPGRFEYTWVSASEGQRWQKVVTAFTEQIHALGPAPRFDPEAQADALCSMERFMPVTIAPATEILTPAAPVQIEAAPASKAPPKTAPKPQKAAKSSAKKDSKHETA